MRKLIFTTDPSIRAKYPQCQHRGCFFGEIENAETIYTDMPAVRDAYKANGIEVEWIGRKPRKKKAVKKHVGLRNNSGS